MALDFLKKLRTIQRRNNSLLCIGLDTDSRKIPAFLRRSGNPVYEFNKRIIEATNDLVCAYKINTSFYETMGATSWETVHRTLDLIPEAIVTIGDGKRGDIANSAEQQAYCFCEDWKFDGSTVNPYMGSDSVEPFIRRREQCAFLLAVTSNPGARDFQYLKVGRRPLYEHVVAKAREWNGKKNIGLVVGATKPNELKRIRAMVPDMPLLIPGIGAQQGDLRAAVRFGTDARGELAIINVGRSVIYASAGKDFQERAREAAKEMRDRMNVFRGRE